MYDASSTAAVIIIEPECGRCDTVSTRERSIHHDVTHDYTWVKVFEPRCKRCKGEWEICLARPVRLGMDDGGQALVKIDYELSDRYCKGYRIICEPRWRLA